jgi:hypothetical protein
MEETVSERKHTSPNGETRFEVRVELSHVDLAAFRRDYAGVTIFREVRQRVAFNLFDPSTWTGQRFVRSGNPGAIVVNFAFLDGAGNDIGARLNLQSTDRPGHFGRFSLFVWGGVGRQPDILGNDARSVRTVRLEYSLPWDTNPRMLTQS